MEPRNFELRYCPTCGTPATPGHLCSAAPCATAAKNLNEAVDHEAAALHAPASAAAASHAGPPPIPHAAPAPLHLRKGRSIGQILLDPRSIRALLASGGGLLVAGLVIWLASLGVFENPIVVATLLGAGTAALLGGGWSTIKFTRFHLAGLALTLLACLVMPLNLWFYHANQLMTLEGNLWIAAVVCCVLYAASATVLRDPLFVYVLMAGIAGTGLLILGDMHKFYEVASPSLMLAIMGLLGIHAERAFPEAEGDFSRKRFGLAFFFSGHALLAGGLVLLLGAQVATYVLTPLFPGWHLGMSAVTTDPTLKMLAIGIVLAGTYAYVYSDLMVRKIGLYIHAAAFTLLWAELLGFQMLNIAHGTELVLAAMAFTALAFNAAYGLTRNSHPRVADPLRPLAMFLSFAPVALGGLLYLRSSVMGVNQLWPYEIGYGYVAAMLVAALATRMGALIHRKNQSGSSAGTYFFLTGAATLTSLAGLLSVTGLTTWASQAPLLMLLPIAYLVASRFHTNENDRDSLLSVAKVIAGFLLISIVAAAVDHLPATLDYVIFGSTNLALATFFAEAAIFYSAAAAIRKSTFNVLVATTMAGAAVWETLRHFDPSANVYIITFGALGLAMLLASRIATLVRDNASTKRFADTWTTAGSGLITVSFLSTAMLVLSRLLSQSYKWDNLTLLGVNAGIVLCGSFLASHVAWKRTLRVMAIVNVAMACVVLAVLGHLTAWQKFEILTTLAGLALLVNGHLGWYREQQTHDDGVSFNLFVGGLLATCPLFVAAIGNRFFGAGFSLPDEMALVTISALLLITGFLLELRSTTLIGGCFLLLQLAMVIADAGLKAQLALGVYLSTGGAIIFLVGLGLAIYREHLTKLPEKIHNREGLFRVLAWR